MGGFIPFYRQNLRGGLRSFSALHTFDYKGRSDYGRKAFYFTGREKQVRALAGKNSGIQNAKRRIEYRM
jgi:hypothetical protein